MALSCSNSHPCFFLGKVILSFSASSVFLIFKYSIFMKYLSCWFAAFFLFHIISDIMSRIFKNLFFSKKFAFIFCQTFKNFLAILSNLNSIILFLRSETFPLISCNCSQNDFISDFVWVWVFNLYKCFCSDVITKFIFTKFVKNVQLQFFVVHSFDNCLLILSIPKSVLFCHLSQLFCSNFFQFFCLLLFQFHLM